MAGSANCRSAARLRPLAFGHNPRLAGIIAVIWSWRNCFYPNDLPDFSGEGACNWRQPHLPENPENLLAVLLVFFTSSFVG
jgi:hypothetical protein